MHKMNPADARRRFRVISTAALPAALLLGGSLARASTDTTWTGANSSDPLDLSSTTNWTPNQKPANGYLATIDNSVQTVPATLYFQNTLTPTAQSYGGILINSSTLTNIYADEQSPASSTTLTDPVYGTSGDGMNEPVFSLGANVNQNVSFSDSTNAPDSLELATATAIMNVTNADATLTINSKISSTSALTTLEKTGSGELALDGGNSYGNNGVQVNIQVNAGTLAMPSSSGFGSGTTTMSLNGGALLFTNTGSISVGHIINVTSSGGEIDNNASGTVTLSSALTGSGSLTKGGTSELYLSSTTGSYNGTITVNNGNLRLTAPGALAYQSTGPSTNATIDLVGSNSTLNIRDSSSGTFNVNVIAEGNLEQIYSTTAGSSTGQTITIGTIALGTTLNVNGSNNYTLAAGTVTLTGTGTILTAGDAFTTTGIAQSGGPASLVKIGANIMTITGSSSYSGGTTVNVGSLTDSTGGVAGAFGSGSLSITPAGTGTLSTASAEAIANSNTTIASTAAVTVNNSSQANGTLVFNSAAPTIASLSGSGNVVLNGASGTALTTGTAGNPTFSGVISDSGGSLSTGSLTVTGSGTFTLAGTGTYFGSTSVSGGTLDVTGALTNSAAVNVNNSSNLVLAGASALPSSAIVNVGATANAFVNAAQTIAAVTSSGQTTFSAGTSIVGTGNGIGTGAGGGSTTGGISGTGTLTVNGTANLYASHIAQTVLGIGSASTVTIADSAAPANTAATSVVTDINNAGTLDLTNNDLIVLDTTQYTTVRNLINTAADGGVWDQPGITSSSARANSSAYGLGYAQASTLGSISFDGQSFTDAVLVKYTLLGDTQLRGQVGIGDYDTVLNNFGSVQDWSGGDFHYGGTVGIGDYDDVLNNFGGTASGNLAARSAVTRGLAPAVSISPNFAKADLQLEVNTVTGDVYVLANTSVGFAGYTVADPSAHLLGGSTSPDPAKLLSVSSANGGNTNVYETAGTYVNWNKITEVANQIAEGQNNNGYANHSSRDDTINVPAGGTIDFGDIYNTTAGVQDITFNFAEAGSNGNPTAGPAYYGAEVDYVTTPEPATLGLLGLGGLALGRRRRRSESTRLPPNSAKVVRP